MRRLAGHARDRRLPPGNLISEIHALVFAGGSAFGLAAASGGHGRLASGASAFGGAARVPIVAAAVLFDLAVGDPKAFPDEAMGRRACDAAAETAPARPRRRGPGDRREAAGAAGLPGGIGVASHRLPDGAVVAALVAVNAFGDVVDPDTGALLAGARAASGARASSSAERASARMRGSTRPWPPPTRPWSASRPPCRSIRAA